MQTPQFTFSSHGISDDVHKKPPLPDYFPPGVSSPLDRSYARWWYVNARQVSLSFTARNGTIIEAELAVGKGGDSAVEESVVLDTSTIMQRKLHTIGDWEDVIPEPLIDDKFSLSRWLNELFGNDLRKQ
jgi:hypothetical protein